MVKQPISSDETSGTTLLQEYLLAPQTYSEFLGLSYEGIKGTLPVAYEWKANPLLPKPTPGFRNAKERRDWLNRQWKRVKRLEPAITFQAEQAHLQTEFEKQLEAEAIATEKYLQRIREQLAALRKTVTSER